MIIGARKQKIRNYSSVKSGLVSWRRGIHTGAFGIYCLMRPQNNWTLFEHATLWFVSLTDPRNASVFLAYFTLFLSVKHVLKTCPTRATIVMQGIMCEYSVIITHRSSRVSIMNWLWNMCLIFITVYYLISWI